MIHKNNELQYQLTLSAYNVLSSQTYNCLCLWAGANSYEFVEALLPMKRFWRNISVSSIAGAKMIPPPSNKTPQTPSHLPHPTTVRYSDFLDFSWGPVSKVWRHSTRVECRHAPGTVRWCSCPHRQKTREPLGRPTTLAGPGSPFRYTRWLERTWDLVQLFTASARSSVVFFSILLRFRFQRSL